MRYRWPLIPAKLRVSWASTIVFVTSIDKNKAHPLVGNAWLRSDDRWLVSVVVFLESPCTTSVNYPSLVLLG